MMRQHHKYWNEYCAIPISHHRTIHLDNSGKFYARRNFTPKYTHDFNGYPILLKLTLAWQVPPAACQQVDQPFRLSQSYVPAEGITFATIVSYAFCWVLIFKKKWDTKIHSQWKLGTQS